MKLSWTGFSKKSLQERLKFLQDYHLLNKDNQIGLEHNYTLPLSTADQMSENVIGTLALPYALVPDVMVDEQIYQVPFATEEPSVVAAATFAKSLSVLVASKQLFTTVKWLDKLLFIMCQISKTP